jgi:tape measure domain-containing protein
MSKQVDERVVSMRFDNQHFEKNVHTSMSTLDKLKQKLNLSGAAKGLDNLNASARKVDMSSLGNGVEAVRSKFSALEVMGVTALANITNSAINAGKRIVSALTIDPVKTGLQEYETQINATQTILANTSHQGTTLEDVNKALDELNKYADLTIYNFTEMTKNIGTFTAAGLDLDTSVKGIQGIANLAAVSGSTSEQASRAMYQLSQALAAGKVNLQDWNSVVNAGMGGKIFQDALARTAKDFGNSVAFDAIEAGETFRNLLNPKDYGDWLTSDVLSATLSKFTKTGAVEYLAELYNISGDSIKELQELGDTTGYNTDEFNKLALSLANGNQETAKYITDTLSMADTATNAATEVKTLSQLWDTLKETAQSGWTQTWELIIGDFDQAKKLFSGLYSFFSGIIEKSSDFRNKLIGGAMGNPFSDFLDKINNSTIGKTVDKVNKLAMSLDEYQKVVNQVWHGDYQNAPVRFELLDEAGYNHKVIQDLVNKGLDYKLTVDDVAESEKKFGVSVKETTKNIEELSDEQLKNAGLTKEEIRMYRDLEKQSKKTGKSIQELVEEMGKKDGRTLLLESFKNAGMGLVTVLKAIKDAWLDVFPPPTVIQLYNIISAMNEFSQKLKVSEETADKVKRTFKGLFSILHIISTVVGGVLNTAFKILKQVLGAFNLNILDVTASIGDAIVKFDEWLTSALDFTGVIKAVVPYLTEAGAAIKEWFSGIKDADNIPKYIVEGLVTGLINGVKLVGQAAIALGKAILEKIKDFLGIHSPSTEFIEVGQNIVSGLVIGIQNGASIVWETLKGIVTKGFEFIKSINWGTILAAALSGGMIFAIAKIAKALEKLASPIEGIGDVLSGLGEALGGFGKYMKGLAFSVRLNAIKNLVLAISLLVGAVILLTFFDKDKLWDSVKILGAIVGILTVLVTVVSALAVLSNKFGAGTIKFSAITLGLIGISASLLILATVVKRIGSIDPEEAKRGFIGLTGLIVELGVLLAAYGLLVKGKAAQNVGGLGKSLLKISIALLILIGVIKLIANMSTRDLTKGLIVIGLLGAFFAALVAVSTLAGKNAVKAGQMFLLISAALLIMVVVIKLIAGMEWDEMSKGLVGLIAFTAFILALVLITKLGGKAAPKLGTMLLAMATAMLVLAIVIKLIAGMEWDELKKGVIGVVVLGLIVSALVGVAAAFAGKNAKLAGMLLAMAVAIGILAGIAVLLGMVDIKSLAKGLIAVGILSALVALMVKSAKGATASVGSIVALAAAVAVLAASLVALSFVDTEALLTSALALTAVMIAFALMTAAASLLKGTDKLVGKLAPLVGVVALLAVILGVMAALDVEPAIETAGSLALLLTAMAAAMFILGNTKTVGKKAMSNLALMGLIVGELAVILGVMKALDVEPAIETAGSLSLLLTAMSAALVILNFVGPNAKSGVGAMALMGLVVGELAVVLGVMDALNLEASITTALSLSILLNAMAAALVILNFAGPNALAGVGVLALMGLVVGELAVILGLMAKFDVNPSIETATALTILLNGMSVALVILGVVGALGPAAFIGIAALATLIAGIGGLIVGIGALVTEFPKLEEFLNTGIPLIEKIGTAIGAFFGNIVGGFIGGALTGALPVIAQDLSDFITNLQPFIDGAKNIDDDVIGGVKTLTEAILTLSKANILEAIGSWLTGSSSIDTFGEQLPKLGTYLNQFASNLGTFGDDQIKSISSAANAIKEMAIAADQIPNEGGWAAEFAGENSIAAFGQQLPQLGLHLSQFADNLGTFGGDQINAISSAANAIKEMAIAADQIPNEGGWAAIFAGENSIATFGSKLPSLGIHLNQFASNLGSFGNAQVEAIVSAAKAIKEMAVAADQIPNEGGWAAAIFGDNSIATFGSKLPSLGTHLNEFASNLGTFTEAQVASVACAAKAIKEMASAATGIDGQAGWAKALFGDNSIATFSTQFPTLGSNLNSFVTNLGTFGDAQITTVSSAVKAIKALADLADADLKGAKKNLEGFGDKIVTLAKDMASFVSGMPSSDSLSTAIKNVEKILKMIDDISGSDANIAANFTKSLKKIGKDGVDKFVEAFTSNSAKTDVKDAGVKLIQQIVKGVESEKSDTQESFKELAESCATKIETVRSDFYDAGKYLVEGFMAGISDNTWRAEAEAAAMARAAVRAAERELGEHSPSKVFYRVGDYAGQGFINALYDYGNKSYSASAMMARSAKQGLSDSISKIKDVIGSDIDAQPTIRPVLDLSDLKTGMGAVNGLFNSRESLGVVANVGSINARMNRSIQNGANSEVVSAIDQLRKDLGSNMGNVYNIDGVTYDDGSNISEAVQALVRAARVERRR